ncbi:hypothetical protein O1M63_50900 [Streptomyces mirabilis]|nr:hypothetical protein [Streptomyces mirabilis]
MDSLDELDALVTTVVSGRVRPARVLLRCLPGTQPHSRFGMDDAELATALNRCVQAGEAVRMEGFSFHLSGYAVQARADLAGRLLELCLKARVLGLEASRISIGGGLPVADTDADSWHTFLGEQHGEHNHAGRTFDPADFYPYHSPSPGRTRCAPCSPPAPRGTTRASPPC